MLRNRCQAIVCLPWQTVIGTLSKGPGFAVPDNHVVRLVTIVRINHSVLVVRAFLRVVPFRPDDLTQEECPAQFTQSS